MAITTGWIPYRSPVMAGTSEWATARYERNHSTKMEGITKKAPATIPPTVPCNLHPMYVATCWASGPGNSMQKLSVLKYWPSETHRFLSTSSLCMMAIWPAGPPKLINPSFTQNQKASPNPASLLFRSSPCSPDSFEVFIARYSNRGYTEGQVTARSRTFYREMEAVS